MVDVMNMEQLSYFNTKMLIKGDILSLITKDLLKQYSLTCQRLLDIK